MIITIVVLGADWIVLALNGQPLLCYHAIYITFLVVRLWLHQQPQEYTLRLAIKQEGAPSDGQKQNQKEMRVCKICQTVKPDRYYHCRRCQKCIYLMDHHCEWVGNCIGQYNSKFYLHLLINISIHSAAVLFLALYNYASLLDVQQYQIYFLITFLPALYALYESHRLIRDFWLAVKKNQTLVESYKLVHGERTSILKTWQKYMGKNRLSWLLPTFRSSQNCDLLEKAIYPEHEQVKEYDDPDDYIYGPLDEEDEAEFAEHPSS